MRRVRSLRLRVVAAVAMFGSLASVGVAMGDTGIGASPGKPVPQGAGDASAIASPVPAGFGSWGEVFAEQDRLNAAAARVRKAAADGRYEGLTNVVADPTARVLVVFWRGSVPTEVRRAAQGVPVRFEPARFTRTQLVGETRRLMATGAFAAVGPRTDGSGVTVHWAEGARRSTVKASTIPMYTDPELSSKADEVVPFACADGARVCREDDYAPYWAGARTNRCTVGWPMRYPDGRTVLLSAGHCGQSGWDVFDGGGDHMGRIEADHDQFDIQTIGASGGGRMWDGGWLNSTFTKPIDRSEPSEPGNIVCTSGSRSGVLCIFAVVNKEWGATIDGVDVWPLNYTLTNGNYGPGQGDSGGPVFSLTPDGNRIVAKGTISSGFRSAQVPCQGENWPGRLCSNHFLYFETALAQLALGTQIVTG